MTYDLKAWTDKNYDDHKVHLPKSLPLTQALDCDNPRNANIAKKP